MQNIIIKRYFIFLVILCVHLTINTDTCAAGPVRYARVYGRNYVYLRDVAGYYGMKCSVDGKKTVLSSKYSRLVFTVDKKYCYINDIKVALLFPSIKYKWHYCISSMDLLKTIDPIMRHWALRKHKLTRIMLDPGHGGKDGGGSGKKLNEKIITLPLARKVASLLKRAGYKVYLTRNSDRFVDLKSRPALARRVNADIFVSIHANKADKTSVSGVESFCMTPAGAASTHSRKNSPRKYPGNQHDVNNAALTYWIQRSLIGKTKTVDRGLKHARFMVIKESTCPSVLVEVGFLSNRREEGRLGTQWYQWKVAQGIVEGILRYHYQLKRRK